MKKFAAFLMILTVSVFTVGCGGGKTEKSGEKSKSPAAEGEKPEGEKPEGEKPEGEKPEGEKPEGEKPEGM